MAPPHALPPPVIVPFWERLPAISRYPLTSSPLLTLIMYAVLAVLLSKLMFGGILRLLVMVAFFKYAFECLRASANGEDEAPDFGMKVSDHVGVAQIWMQAIFILLLIGGYWAGGYTGLYIVLGVISLAQPGANMSLAIDMNLWHALNPLTWMRVLARIPGPYIGVTLLIFVFQSSQETLTTWVAGAMPRFIAEILIQISVNYTILATFHLMGWLIWQYQEELGYEPERKIVLKSMRDDPDQALIDRAEALTSDGRLTEARDFLAGEIRSRGATPAVHDRYRKLLKALNELPALLEHGRTYISVLLAQDKDKPALELLRECQGLDPGFMPGQPEDVGRLARQAVRLGHTELALRVLAAFPKLWPKSKDIAPNLYYAAQLMTEKLGQDEKAKGLLVAIRQKFPDHPVIADVDALLTTLMHVQPTRPKTAG